MLQSQRIVFLFVILAIILAPCLKADDNQKLKVTILYESLCPDSVKFILRQLSPSYSRLQDYIELEFVPFGKSFSKNNGQEFICQHGPSECKGNRLQSCILHHTPNQKEQVKVVACQMGLILTDTFECSKYFNFNPIIEDCINSSLGTELQLQAEKITRKYNPNFVPTIIYNDVFNQQLQDRSIRNFHSTVCFILNEQRVDGLSSSNGPCSGIEL